MEKNKAGEQLVFDWDRWEKSCRYCIYLSIVPGVSGKEGEKKQLFFACGLGQFEGGGCILHLRTTCTLCRIGRKKMGYVDLKKLSEEQLRIELDNIRKGRVGFGRAKRSARRERRIDNVRKSKVIKEGATRLTIHLD